MLWVAFAVGAAELWRETYLGDKYVPPEAYGALGVAMSHHPVFKWMPATTIAVAVITFVLLSMHLADWCMPRAGRWAKD